MRNTCGGNGLPLAYASCAVFNQTPSSRWGLYAVARIRELNPAGLAVARIRELTQPVLKPRGSASLHPGLYAVPS